jgi:hypothetical protein
MAGIVEHLFHLIPEKQRGGKTPREVEERLDIN